MSKIHFEQSIDNCVKEIKVKPIEFFEQQNNHNVKSSSSENGEASIKEEIQYTEKQLEILQQKKEKMLQATKEEINMEKENWNKEKESYIEQANKEGYEAGFALGKNESMEKYNNKINEANFIIKSAQGDYHSVVEQSEQKIVDLAIHTATKIIKQKISDDPQTFLPIVKGALNEIKDEPSVSIYLHPKNYTHVLKEKKELNEVLDGDTKVEIYIDQHIEENGCLIKHTFGQIDASVHTQLDQIHYVLNDISMENKDEPN